MDKQLNRKEYEDLEKDLNLKTMQVTTEKKTLSGTNEICRETRFY